MRGATWKRSVAGGVALLLVQAAALAAGDPLDGTWELQPALSSYPDGAAPRKMTLVIEVVDGALHYRSSTETSTGTRTNAEFTAAFDGVPVLVTGSVGLLAPVALQRPDAYTLEATYARPFHPLASSRWTVSPDGERLTIATTATAAEAAARTNVAVYRRVP